MSSKNWAKEYDQYKDYKFQAGEILTTFDGSPARLTIDLNEGKQPFIYGVVYLPQIVGQALGWYLHEYESDSFFGMKCILVAAARDKVLHKLGVGLLKHKVKSLKVIRYSNTGKSLLCEIHEWWPEETVEEPVVETPVEDVVAETVEEATA